MGHAFFSGSPVTVTLTLPQQQLPVWVDMVDDSFGRMYIRCIYKGRYYRKTLDGEWIVRLVYIVV